MPIDFHAPENRDSYASRAVDAGWMEAMRAIAVPAGRRVLDIGCGGGIYARAWHRMGAASVTGVDFSAAMLATARERSAGMDGLTFVLGDARATGLPDACADIVFERALVHHVPDWLACLREAHRLLAPGGICIVQDKTPEDIQAIGVEGYIGADLFDRFPRLLQIELRRRPAPGDVSRALLAAGIVDVGERCFVETHRTYSSFAELAESLRLRTGRSIAHELADAELDVFISWLRHHLNIEGPIVERVPWTLWWGRRRQAEADT